VTLLRNRAERHVIDQFDNGHAARMACSLSVLNTLTKGVNLLKKANYFWNRLPIPLFYVGVSGITNGKARISPAPGIHAD